MRVGGEPGQRRPPNAINDRAGQRGHILQGGVRQRRDPQNKQVLGDTICLRPPRPLKLLTFSPSGPPFVTFLILQALSTSLDTMNLHSTAARVIDVWTEA